MKNKLEPGMFIEKRIETSPDMAASRFHESSPRVLSTPSLITFLQTTCADLMAPFLDEGEMAVSTRIEVNHFASTPIGMAITIRAEVKELDRNRIFFQVQAFDEMEEIASGYNDMYVINEERFERGIRRKLERTTKG
ncbi:MAG TPA: hotdog domain-containing protein [Thermodesulfobacteriota bacterium]|nr:hotdog domain-containing protein [Thermodesulfobacteriota bacterium]